MNSKTTRLWIISLMIVFMMLGASWGTWFTRFPTIRETLNLSLTEMSFLVLLPSVGMIGGLLIASRLVVLLGERVVIIAGISIMGVMLPAATWTLLLDGSGSAFFGHSLLFIFGAGFGIADVATNVSGSNAERAAGTSRMMVMHAGFSVGGIASVLFGAWAEHAKLGLLTHQISTFAIFIVTTVFLSRWIGTSPALRFSPAQHSSATQHSSPTHNSSAIHNSGESQTLRSSTTEDPPASSAKMRVWRNPVVLLLGFIGLAGSLADGVAADWMPLAFIDEYGLESGPAVFMLSLMFTGELIMRLFGDKFVSRFGRKKVLRATLTSAFIGILLVALSPSAWLAAPGAFLWGAGAALAFPISISAAASDPRTAASKVSAVSTIGYTAYAGGPVAFGVMGDHLGFRIAFLMLAVIIVLAWFGSAAVKDQN
ncbi:MAG TPA: MFS transporter [Microbacteriaceae bacterium]|nr:MFS transporter [Microbacteriaceae bacterium]